MWCCLLRLWGKAVGDVMSTLFGGRSNVEVWHPRCCERYRYRYLNIIRRGRESRNKGYPRFTTLERRGLKSSRLLNRAIARQRCGAEREPTKKHAARKNHGDAGTARQCIAKTSNWTGRALPAKRPGTLTKVYFGMIKQSSQEALRERQILRRQTTRHGTGHTAVAMTAMMRDKVIMIS